MKVNIDREGCISCGLCESVCPAVFRLSQNDGLAEVYGEISGNEEVVKEAADSCPTSVIDTD